MPYRAYHDLAAYNEWANGRLYEAAGRLPDESYRRACGAFFGSVHGTLNHLLVADRIWMDRFQGLNVPMPPLDSILFEEPFALRCARAAEDTRIRAFVETLDAEALAAEIVYATSSGRAVRQSLASALDHFFNHQTHHRGQIHCLLTVLAGRAAAPSLDLIQFQREQPAHA
ncbi:DinB family protein [Aquabacter spiritensis]|uniref:Putative damage-inducible protein DinB n=1 Tax=Aquabacter spiritensis TaxID=933073 RepID=A0A4V2UXF1_9HYPH|nr:DinB family protein [Aquabacter spiritensis]TCT03258.1 putative damage-inducible protein DinB [Aquabacter spiritensis]